MIHKHIKSLPHHPKRVIIISLIVAVVIGIFGYIKINEKTTDQFVKNNDTSIADNSSLYFLSSGKVKNILVKVGDNVKKGEVLATIDTDNVDGALIQAKAAYEIAKANYQKVINGATGSTIDVAKAAVNTAKVNLDEVTKQQDILVGNAYRNLLNSTPEAVPVDNTGDYTAPIISGNYNLNKEGILKINFYYGVGGVSFNVSDLSKGSGSCNTITSQPLGNSGLYIKCPTNIINISDWKIEIPNKKASNYLTNYNAYQSALQTQSQAIAGAQATFNQANTSLESIIIEARPEDVSIAKAQIENAYGLLISNSSYNRTIIVAPEDGKITAIYVKEGEIISSDVPAIGFINSN